MLAITDDDYLELRKYCKTCIDDEQLIDHAKIPNLIFRTGANQSTLLEMAIKYDNYRFIDYLLNKGHDINFYFHEYHPVMYTLWTDNIRTLVFLINRGSHVLSIICSREFGVVSNTVRYILIVYGIDITINRYINNELLLTYSPEL
jgi:hypothetical protein